MNSKTVIWIFVLLLLVPLLSSIVFAQTSFRFVVLPDTHTDCTKDKTPATVTKALPIIINEIKPQFVLHVGDMVNFETKKSKTAPCPDVMWSKFNKEVRDKLTAADILFFPSPGNHDSQFGMSEDYKERWSNFKNIGFSINGNYDSWYSFDIGKSHFVSLVAPGTIRLEDSKNQMKWLEEDLKKAKDSGAENLFTFAHSPMYVPAMKKGSRVIPSDTSWLAKEKGLSDLLKKYNVKIHFSGHMHVYSDKTTDGIRDIIAGMLWGGKGTLTSLGKTQDFTFLVVDVNGQDIKVYPVTYPWKVSHIPPAKDASLNLKSQEQTIPVGKNLEFGTISSTLYDVVISTSLGKTSVLGIARQPIAVGVKKKQFIMPQNFVCKNLTSTDKLDVEQLKKYYGANKIDVEAQIIDLDLKFDKAHTIKVHRKIAPVLKCVEKEIGKCAETAQYEINKITGFEWAPVGDTLAPSSFGVTITINPDANPSSDILRTNIPECIIKAFQSKGFYWGGNFSTTKFPSTFYFLGDPSSIAMYDATTNSALNPAASSVPASGDCKLKFPDGLDTQSVGYTSTKRGGGHLENGFEFPKETEYTKRTRDDNYCTTELAQAIYGSTCLAFPVTKQKIGVGDFSMKNGGDIPGHGSHESGRDVDFWFYSTDKIQGTSNLWYACADDKAKPCNANKPVKSNFDVVANWEFIKQLYKNNDIQYVFIHCALRKKLLDYGKDKDPDIYKKFAYTSAYVKHHNHHFHIRIKCPPGDTRCRGD